LIKPLIDRKKEIEAWHTMIKDTITKNWIVKLIDELKEALAA